MKSKDSYPAPCQKDQFICIPPELKSGRGVIKQKFNSIRTSSLLTGYELIELLLTSWLLKNVRASPLQQGSRPTQKWQKKQTRQITVAMKGEMEHANLSNIISNDYACAQTKMKGNTEIQFKTNTLTTCRSIHEAGVDTVFALDVASTLFDSTAG